jgi:hypothetical protein
MPDHQREAPWTIETRDSAALSARSCRWSSGRPPTDRHRGYLGAVVTPEELFHARNEPFEPPLNDEMLRLVESELGVTLPDPYVSLCRAHNGGVLTKTAHPMNVRTSWADDHIAVHSVAAIGRTADFSLCGTIGSRFWLREWGYPDVGVYFADCPSAGHDMLALDYRAAGEPRVVHVDQELDYAVTVVAPNFAAFLDGLTDGEEFDLE